MNLDLRSTGASFVAGKQENNPRDLIIEVIEKNPEADRKTRFEEFRTLLQDSGDDYQRAVDFYFFINMHDYLTTNRSHRHRVPLDRAAAKQHQSIAVENIKAQIVMLDLTMPNGKSMRDCTGSEMATFGSRFQRIAEKVGKTKIVGAVLNEEQIKAIMK